MGLDETEKNTMLLLSLSFSRSDSRTHAHANAHTNKCTSINDETVVMCCSTFNIPLGRSGQTGCYKPTGTEHILAAGGADCHFLLRAPLIANHKLKGDLNEIFSFSRDGAWNPKRARSHSYNAFFAQKSKDHTIHHRHTIMENEVFDI